MNDSATPASLPGWLWIPRLVAAGILGQTLFFKFTAAPESVYIFEKVGAGAAGELLRHQLMAWFRLNEFR